MPATQVKEDYEQMLNDHLSTSYFVEFSKYGSSLALSLVTANPYIKAGLYMYDVDDKIILSEYKDASDNNQSLLIIKWEFQGEYFSHIRGTSYYPWDEKTLPFSVGEQLDIS